METAEWVGGDSGGLRQSLMGLKKTRSPFCLAFADRNSKQQLLSADIIRRDNGSSSRAVGTRDMCRSAGVKDKW